MNITEIQKKNLIEASKKHIDTQFKDRLIQDFGIELQYAIGLIKSAAIANLYIAIKGSKETEIIGFRNKAELLEAIIILSSSNDWIAFSKLSNKGSFTRKIKGYKEEVQKGSYEGLSFLVSKKSSNRISKNAKKITDKQLEELINIKSSNLNMSASKVYKKMNESFCDLKVKKATIAYYTRNIEVDNFKKKMR